MERPRSKTGAFVFSEAERVTVWGREPAGCPVPGRRRREGRHSIFSVRARRGTRSPADPRRGGCSAARCGRSLPAGRVGAGDRKNRKSPLSSADGGRDRALATMRDAQVRIWRRAEGACTDCGWSARGSVPARAGRDPFPVRREAWCRCQEAGISDRARR